MKVQKTLYSIKKAGYERRFFSISKKEPGKTWKKLTLSEADELNREFSSGRISFEECHQGFKKILDQIYESRDGSTTVMHSGNRRIMDEYYAVNYLKMSRQRRLAKSTMESTYNDLLRAIKSIGALDLRHTKTDKLQEAVDQFFEGYKNTVPHSKAVMRINSMLKFIGRPESERLESLPEEHGEVKNLSFDEAREVISQLDGYVKILSEIAYFTGLRMGEIFSLKKSSVQKIRSGGFSILVNSQMLRSGEITLPKRRKIRRTFGLIGCECSLNKWLDTDMEVRKSIRLSKYSDLIKNACIKADTSQEITFKDWRHCYAINLLNGGATLSQVASNLGNSEAVCRKHYLGYTLTNDGIEIVARNYRLNSSEFESF